MGRESVRKAVFEPLEPRVLLDGVPEGGASLSGLGAPWTDVDLNTGTGTGPAGVVRILGDDYEDRSGRAVSRVGDVNGDGFDDFAVGAGAADPAGGTGAGETYLVFGHGGAWSDIDLNTGTGTGPAGVVRILGDDADDSSGRAVAAAGDVNGDGYGDFLIGADAADPAGGGKAGETYLVLGHGGAWSDIDLDTGTGTGPAGVIRILGDDALDSSGYAVASAGDVNGDGFDDLLIGAPWADTPGGDYAGEAYLLFGHDGAWSDIDLDTGTGTGPAGVIRILGDDAGDDYGISVASAGDVNGDGFGDFLIGAYFADPAGGAEAGEVYLVFGHDGAWGDIDLNTGTGTGPAGVVRILGDDPSDWSGGAVAGAGDVNGDGFDDFLIGADSANPPGGTHAGETYLVFGRDGTWSDIDLNTGTGTGPAGVVRILGDDARDYSGTAVAAAGDVDGDGYADFLIGAHSADPPGGTDAGETYLVFGHGGAWADIDLNTGTGTGPAGVVRILGDDARDYSGTAVAAAGDVDGDGYADFLIGADSATPPGGTHAGETYLLFGHSDFPDSVTWTGVKSTDWEDTDNWTGGAAPGAQTAAVFDEEGDNSPSLYGDETARGVDLRTAEWTIGGSGQELAVGPDGVDSAGSGTSTIGPTVALAADSTWTVGTGNTLVLDGGLTGADYTLTKDGEGTLVLGGSQGAVVLKGLSIGSGKVALGGGSKVLVLNSLWLGSGGPLGDLAAAVPVSGSRVSAASGAVESGLSDADAALALANGLLPGASAGIGAEAAPPPLAALPADVPAWQPAAGEGDATGEPEYAQVAVPHGFVLTEPLPMPPPAAPAPAPSDPGDGLLDVLALVELVLPLGA